MSACPTCGGETVIQRDAHGYGAELEHCERVLHCGWMVIHAWPRRANAPRHYTRVATYGGLQAQLLAALPPKKTPAPAREIAAAIGREPGVVGVRLRQLARTGKVATRPGVKYHTPAVFWRAA